MQSKAKGYEAEQAAEKYLQKQGLVALARNITFKTGEIDLIMQEGDTLVFVEVRYRKSSLFGSPAETVTPSKQKKLIQTALLYCQRKGVTSPWRIDVIEITGSQINWIPSAITAEH